MRLQAVLTPTESKLLISKATIAQPAVRRALDEDVVLIHPSSTTVFMMKELGVPLPTGMWVCGLTQPRGLCASGQILEEGKSRGAAPYDPGQYSHSWGFVKGEFIPGGHLQDWLAKFTSNSVYIKAVNAIDPEGHPALLFSARGGGTIGLVIRAQREKKFTLIIPTGLEKLIPTTIAEASKACVKHDIVKATGTPVGLMPLDGELITEIKAFKDLCGVDAVPVAAGGIGGAEGSVVFILLGEKAALDRAQRLVDEIKGAKLPDLYLLECEWCTRDKCHDSLVGRKRRAEAEAVS